jgi:hypothetical protein
MRQMVPGMPKIKRCCPFNGKKVFHIGVKKGFLPILW